MLSFLLSLSFFIFHCWNFFGFFFSFSAFTAGFFNFKPFASNCSLEIPEFKNNRVRCFGFGIGNLAISLGRKQNQ